MVASIGIFGGGFVGGALARGFAQTTDVKVYDIDPDKGNASFSRVCDQDILFLCLPTPMKSTGECDCELIESELGFINSEMSVREERRPVVIRSTIPPNFLRDNWEQWEFLDLVFMPEFLTERTADLDFLLSTRFIFGTRHGDPVCPSELQSLFRARFPGVRQAVMTWEEASFVKYGTNGFFTTKLSFFNELAEGMRGAGIVHPQKVIDEILNDGRIGRSHSQVPGHDGDRGWGGHCFPKDNRAISYYLREVLGRSAHMFDASWAVNDMVRINRDWEKMVGRAVSDEGNSK